MSRPSPNHRLYAHIFGDSGSAARASVGYRTKTAEGDKVVTRLTAVGTHEGDLPSAPRTGNDLLTTAIVIHRIADGKLVEKWSETDLLGFLPQIGVLPAQEPAEN